MSGWYDNQMNVFIDHLIAQRKSSIDRLRSKLRSCSFSELKDEEVATKLGLFIYDKEYVDPKEAADFEPAQATTAAKLKSQLVEQKLRKSTSESISAVQKAASMFALATKVKPFIKRKDLLFVLKRYKHELV